MNVMYFSADWCVPCKSFKPIVEQVSQDLGVAINYINVDYDASLTQQYSITSVPTILVTNNRGEVVHRKTGVMSREHLIQLFNKLN
jgi:thioredoxin 1